MLLDNRDLQDKISAYLSTESPASDNAQLASQHTFITPFLYTSSSYLFAVLGSLISLLGGHCRKIFKIAIQLHRKHLGPFQLFVIVFSRAHFS